jgi:hypothetical protein
MATNDQETSNNIGKPLTPNVSFSGQISEMF